MKIILGIVWRMEWSRLEQKDQLEVVLYIGET